MAPWSEHKNEMIPKTYEYFLTGLEFIVLLERQSVKYPIRDLCAAHPPCNNALQVIPARS